MPYRSTFVFLAAGFLAACASDEAPPQPAPHDCFEFVSSIPFPASKTLTLRPDTGRRDFIGELSPLQPTVLVSADGALSGEFILVGPYRSATDTGISSALPAISGNALKFDAPRKAGSYVLKQTTAENVRDLGELEVVATPIAVCAASEIEPSAELTVVWVGPSATGDIIDVFDPVTGAVFDTVAVDGSPYEANATLMIAPPQSGEYSVRYVSSDGFVQLTTRSLVIQARDTGILRAPEVADPGETINVQWIGPQRPGHRFRLIEQGTRRELVSAMPSVSTIGSGTAQLRTPGPGQYVIEYADPETGPPAAVQNLRVGNN